MESSVPIYALISAVQFHPCDTTHSGAINWTCAGPARDHASPHLETEMLIELEVMKRPYVLYAVFVRYERNFHGPRPTNVDLRP